MRIKSDHQQFNRSSDIIVVILLYVATYYYSMFIYLHARPQCGNLSISQLFLQRRRTLPITTTAISEKSRFSHFVVDKVVADCLQYLITMTVSSQANNQLTALYKNLTVRVHKIELVWPRALKSRCFTDQSVEDYSRPRYIMSPATVDRDHQIQQK